MSVSWPEGIVEAVNFALREFVASGMLSGRNSDKNVQATGIAAYAKHGYSSYT